MTDKVIQVLTFKSIDTILGVGGTQSWTLDVNRAQACKYVVCCRKTKTRDAEGNEPHGSAFMVGLISDVVPSTENVGRWLVLFSDYALVQALDQWEGRNPVRFYTVDDFDEIDFNNLEWKPMPEPTARHATQEAKHGMTIAEAKTALAAAFGVHPSAVEITIRG